MREVWPIPRIHAPVRDGWLEEWLLSMPLQTCGQVLMIAWRTWYARNEVTHDKTWYALVSMATNTERDNSSFGHLVVDLRNLSMSPRVLTITSHELARFGMVEDRTQVWVGSAPCYYSLINTIRLPRIFFFAKNDRIRNTQQSNFVQALINS
jgi:hypothetical protein